MLFGSDAWIDTILTRIVSAITPDGGPLPADRAIIYLGETLDLLQLPPADQFAVVGPLDMPVDPADVRGGGSPYTPFDARVRVDVCSRCDRDREGDNRVILLDTADGLAPLVRKIVKRLQLNTLSIDSVSLLREPMRLVSVQFNPRRPNTGWAWCRTTWNVKFRTDFTVG